MSKFALSSGSSHFGDRQSFFADTPSKGNSWRSQYRKLGRPSTSVSTTEEEGGMDGSDERTPLFSGALSHMQSNAQGKKLYEDDRAWVRYPFVVLHKTWQVLASNYVNFLLVFVPVGIVLGALNIDPTAIFVINFLAIIPLASLLSFATEELSVKLGQTIGGLLNATFGNAVELIVCVSGFADKLRLTCGV